MSVRQTIEQLSASPDAWFEHDGLWHPAWEVVAERLDREVAAEHEHEAWTLWTRVWLERLVAGLGSAYRIEQEQELIVVTADDEGATARLMGVALDAEWQTLRLLPGIASAEGPGQRVMILADTMEDYYRYVDAYYRDRGSDSFGPSTGMCLSRGFIHQIINRVGDWERVATIRHETAHECLAHLGLPIWLEEGLVQLVEAACDAGVIGSLTAYEILEHRDYWTADNLDAFWRGESFSRNDDGQGLSYRLAEWMVQDQLVHNREAFMAWVPTFAEIQDAETFARKSVAWNMLPPFLRYREW